MCKNIEQFKILENFKKQFAPVSWGIEDEAVTASAVDAGAYFFSVDAGCYFFPLSCDKQFSLNSEQFT
jgi:hypothetical protein